MGGIAIFLTLLVLGVLVVGGAVLYATGGALWAGKTDPEADRVEGGPDGAGHRPEHTRPEDVAQDRTGFVGTPGGDEAARS